MCVPGKQIRGFEELGGTDDFHEDTLAFVLRWEHLEKKSTSDQKVSGGGEEGGVLRLCSPLLFDSGTRIAFERLSAGLINLYSYRMHLRRWEEHGGS